MHLTELGLTIYLGYGDADAPPATDLPLSISHAPPAPAGGSAPQPVTLPPGGAGTGLPKNRQWPRRHFETRRFPRQRGKEQEIERDAGARETEQTRAGQWQGSRRLRRLDGLDYRKGGSEAQAK